jgi:hypothetical protein
MVAARSFLRARHRQKGLAELARHETSALGTNEDLSRIVDPLGLYVPRTFSTSLLYTTHARLPASFCIVHTNTPFALYNTLPQFLRREAG